MCTFRQDHYVGLCYKTCIYSKFDIFCDCVILSCYNKTCIYSRFEFVKTSGSKITPINLPPGQEINGRVLKHIAGNGPVYLRAKENDLAVEVSRATNQYEWA